MTIAPTTLQPGRHHHRSRWVLMALAAFVLGGLSVGLLYHFDVFGGSSSSTTDGSGVSATQIRHVAAFTGVELLGSNNVVIRVGGKQSVVVRADENLINRVTTEVRSARLVIANTPGSFTTKSRMSVEVDVPALSSLALTGSGNILVSGIDTPSFKVALPGSGTLTGSGTTRRLEASVTGSGTVQLTRLVARDVRAAVSGSGSIFVTATNTLAGTVSGSGAILYVGNPLHVTKSVTGTGAITGT